MIMFSRHSTRRLQNAFNRISFRYPCRRCLSDVVASTEPSESYLRGTLQPGPLHKSQNTDSKLLVLDLNGALLLRGPLTKGPRAIWPRPYMHTFSTYLFHNETQSWLDTMVWSSAQPRNVFDMVNTCFPTSHPSLLRVWARDRMSLPPEQYRQKVSTVKNLEKVWFELRSLRHSLYSTLLMDDSADKAKLQPYNHLIVPEYQESIRNVDLEVLRCESKVGRANEDYDDTLLCVIGILEAVKQQQNVANWIRKGGLVLEETQDTPFRDSNTQNWWQIPEIKKHWRQEGLLVLDKLQIQLQPFRHGRR